MNLATRKSAVRQRIVWSHGNKVIIVSTIKKGLVALPVKIWWYPLIGQRRKKNLVKRENKYFFSVLVPIICLGYEQLKTNNSHHTTST